MYSRQEQRRGIKSTLDYESARRRRANHVIKLRKKRKDEHMRKRRKEDTGAKYDINVRDKLKRIPHLASQLKSEDPNQQLVATIFIRQLLAMESTPPIDEITRAGFVPLLVQFLNRNEMPQLQFEACWAITNICSGSETQTNIVLRCNAVPTLIGLLSSNNEQVREQAVWALGNISGDSPRVRDYVLKCNILHPLFKLIEHRPNIQTLRTAVWCLSNLCRGKPLVDYQVVVKTIPLLSYLIYNSDNEVLTDTCWAISYISDGRNNRIQCVIESNLVKRLVELLSHYHASIQTPALRTIGNLVTGNDTQTQAVISCGALPVFRTLLTHKKKSIRKEAVWTLSNICAGSQNQLQAVIECSVFDKIIEFLKRGDFEVRREATWCVTNALMTGTSKQVQHLVTCGVVKPICDVLGLDDTQIVLVALDGVHALLERGKKLGEKNNTENVYSIFVEKAGGVDQLEELQDHKNHEVYEKAFKILQQYFEVADGEGGPGGPPAIEGPNNNNNNNNSNNPFGFKDNVQKGTYDF